MIDVGNDLVTFPDLDLSRTITGLPLLAQHVMHEWTTSRRSLFYAPHVGDSVNALINGDRSPRELRAWEARLASRALKVPGVVRCVATITVAQETLTISGTIWSSEGAIDVVMTLSEAAQVLALETKIRVNAR